MENTTVKTIGFKVDPSGSFERLAKFEAADADVAQAIAVIAALPASARPFQTDFNLFNSYRPIGWKNDANIRDEP